MVNEAAVFLSLIPATSKGTPDMFYKPMSQITALRLHPGCFDKWEHTKVVLQFSLDESFLLASNVRSGFYAISAAVALPFCGALLMSDCWNRKVKS